MENWNDAKILKPEILGRYITVNSGKIRMSYYREDIGWYYFLPNGLPVNETQTITHWMEFPSLEDHPELWKKAKKISPEKSGHYIVSTNDGYSTDAYYRKDVGWYSELPSGQTKNQNENIKYWRNFPELPKKEKIYEEGEHCEF